MAEDQVQLPRCTSTPLTNRKSSNVLNNFMEVSPIFATSEKTKKSKSMIPLLTNINGMSRSIGIKPIAASSKVSSLTNSTGQGGSGSVKIPVQIPTVEELAPTQTKAQVAKAAPAKEPRSSVNEVINSVISSQSQKETKTSPRESGAQDIAQTKTSRVSKICVRPSTLQMVPEETSVEGTGQPPEDCILKKAETQCSWLIPKEIKSKVSLKRKSNVPPTVTKRNKKSVAAPSQDDESIFSSPDIPNLVEVSSLSKKRKTYVLKKKEIANILKEHNESVTEGIIPLEDVNDKSLNIKIKQGNSEEKLHETVALKNNEISKQAESKNKVEERDEGKENVEILCSPKVKAIKNKRTMNKQHKTQLEEHTKGGPAKRDIESLLKTAVKDIETVEVNKEVNQEIIMPTEKSKILEVDTISGPSEESKRKNTKSKKKEFDKNQQENIALKPAKNKPETRRTLRERKTNKVYCDDSEILPLDGDSKEKGTKNKKVSKLKISQEEKENSHVLPVESKSVRKKTDKGAKKVSNTISASNEKLCQNVCKTLEDTSNCVQASSNKENLDLETHFQDKTTPKNADDRGLHTDHDDKKEGIKKVKRISKKNLKTQAEKMEEKSNEILHEEIQVQQSTSKRDVATSSSAKKTQKKAQSRKQNSIPHNDVNQTNEGQSQVHAENKVCLQNDTEPGLPQSAEEDPSQTSGEKVGKQFDEEKDQTRKKSILRKHTSKSQTRTKPKTNEAGEYKTSDNVPLTSATSLGKKRKSEDLESAPSHSESPSKRRRHDHGDSEKVESVENRFSVKDLLGMQGEVAQQLRPGILVTRSIFIPDQVMIGEVCFDPGAVLSKISTHTTYSVQEGTACVKIKNHIKYFNASDSQRKFYIPKNIDASITNTGSLPLKMDFVKFRG